VLCGFLGVPKIPELLSGGIGAIESPNSSSLQSINSFNTHTNTHTSKIYNLSYAIKLLAYFRKNSTTPRKVISGSKHGSHPIFQKLRLQPIQAHSLPRSSGFRASHFEMADGLTPRAEAISILFIPVAAILIASLILS